MVQLALLHTLLLSASADKRPLADKHPPANKRPPFSVLWNSPGPSCCGVKAENELLPDADPLPQFAEFNITGNDKPSSWSRGRRPCNATTNPCFNGQHVVTIYTEQTGLYPSYKQNETTKEWTAINGGLPQVRTYLTLSL